LNFIIIIIIIIIKHQIAALAIWIWIGSTKLEYQFHRWLFWTRNFKIVRVSGTKRSQRV